MYLQHIRIVGKEIKTFRLEDCHERLGIDHDSGQRVPCMSRRVLARARILIKSLLGVSLKQTTQNSRAGRLIPSGLTFSKNLTIRYVRIINIVSLLWVPGPRGTSCVVLGAIPLAFRNIDPSESYWHYP